MDTNYFKERLAAEKIQLEGELATVGRVNPSNPRDWEATPSEHSPESDPTEVADASEAFQENQAILEDLEVRYNQVLKAIVSIEKGTYGTCEICHEAIEDERLKANPAARTCMTHIEEEKNLAL